MTANPLRLLVAGYAFAAAAGLQLHFITGGLLGPLLVFWLGGAFLVLTLGVLKYDLIPFWLDRRKKLQDHATHLVERIPSGGPEFSR